MDTPVEQPNQSWGAKVNIGRYGRWRNDDWPTWADPQQRQKWTQGGLVVWDDASQHLVQGADLLITNHTMPHLSGLDLVKILRARHVTISIVMISAQPTQAADALTAGVTHFPLKPFTLTNLVQVLTRLLQP